MKGDRKIIKVTNTNTPIIGLRPEDFDIKGGKYRIGKEIKPGEYEVIKND